MPRILRSSNDLEIIVSSILMEASIRIDRDLEILSEEIEKINSTNKNIQKLIEELNKDILESNDHDKGIQVTDFFKKTAYLNSKLDNTNEISEMTSLRLQMMMDRRSKFISALSNIMKISTTQDSLVQNLK